METIYFDTCALNRLTDDLSQPRIHAEASAVEQILALVMRGEVRWVTSTVVRLELSRNPDEDRREQTLPLLHFAGSEIAPTPAMFQAGQAFEREGLDGLDALHLGVSVSAGADYLLTVDDRLIHRAARIRPGLKPEVINPVNWLARRVQ